MPIASLPKLLATLYCRYEPLLLHRVNSIKKLVFIAITLLLYSMNTQAAFAQKNTLTFLAEELPPYHYLNTQGEPEGAFVEIVQAILQHAELSGQVTIQPFARSFQAVKNQPNNFLISLLKTPHRENEFQWLGEIYKSYAVLVGIKDRQNLKLSSLQDAIPYSVGTIRGYHSASFLLKNGFVEQQNLSLSVTSRHMWAMLFNQRIDLVMTNYMALDRDIEKAGFDAEDVTPYLYLNDFPNQLNIATGLTTDSTLVRKLSASFNSIKNNGTYQNILKKYNLQ